MIVSSVAGSNSGSKNESLVLGVEVKLVSVEAQAEAVITVCQAKQRE